MTRRGLGISTCSVLRYRDSPKRQLLPISSSGRIVFPTACKCLANSWRFSFVFRDDSYDLRRNVSLHSLLCCKMRVNHTGSNLRANAHLIAMTTNAIGAGMLPIALGWGRSEHPCADADRRHRRPDLLGRAQRCSSTRWCSSISTTPRSGSSRAFAGQSVVEMLSVKPAMFARDSASAVSVDQGTFGLLSSATCGRRRAVPPPGNRTT